MNNRPGLRRYPRSNLPIIAVTFALWWVISPSTLPGASAALIDVPGDYPTIQEAINAARDGDTVQIADGIYTGELNKNLEFFGKAITVRSASGDPTKCILIAGATAAGSISVPAKGRILLSKG
jgi:hypothetical protein